MHYRFPAVKRSESKQAIREAEMPGILRGGRQGAGSLVVTGARAFVMDDDTFPAVRSGVVKYATRINDGSGQASPPIFKGKAERWRFQPGQRVK